MDKNRVFNKKIISNNLGDIHRIFRINEDEINIAEVYSSRIKKGCVKGWKQHTKMTSNLLVISGSVKFTILNRDGELNETLILNDSNQYGLLTINPMEIIKFEGLSDISIILNIADMLHSPDESINYELSYFE